MVFSRRAFACLAMSVLVGVSLSAGVSHAASNAKVSIKRVGLNKVYVPGSMIKGSSVASGRSFYKSSMPELSLANVRLGRPARDVLTRWGNPTRITLGTVTAEVTKTPGPTGPQYTPGPGGIFDPMAMGLPPLAGLNPPGAPGRNPQQPDQQSGNETSVLNQEEVTWTYDLQNGITLEFIITDGVVTQITVGGVGPWGLSKTRSGLQLGDTYKLVLWVCGYPEEQKYVGRFLRASYVEKSHVLYTFLNRKLVGVTIALVPTEIK